MTVNHFHQNQKYKMFRWEQRFTVKFCEFSGRLDAITRKGRNFRLTMRLQGSKDGQSRCFARSTSWSSGERPAFCPPTFCPCTAWYVPLRNVQVWTIHTRDNPHLHFRRIRYLTLRVGESCLVLSSGPGPGVTLSYTGAGFNFSDLLKW